MKAVIGGKECYIYWEHSRGEKEVMIGRSIVNRRTTTCHFKFRGETPETPIILKEEIIQNPNTPYDKERARKLSLAKLFDVYQVSKEERKAVWHTYFSRFEKEMLPSELEDALQKAFSSIPGFGNVMVKQVGRIDVSPRDNTTSEDDDY